MVPFPLRAPQTWTYASKDGALHQNWSIWGPVKVRGPRGDAPGYVIATSEERGPASSTVERHFVPGVGFVREILVSSLGGTLASRHDLAMTD